MDSPALKKTRGPYRQSMKPSRQTCYNRRKKAKQLTALCDESSTNTAALVLQDQPVAVTAPRLVPELSEVHEQSSCAQECSTSVTVETVQMGTLSNNSVESSLEAS